VSWAGEARPNTPNLPLNCVTPIIIVFRRSSRLENGCEGDASTLQKTQDFGMTSHFALSAWDY
jgi:hypothetical protein